MKTKVCACCGKTFPSKAYAQKYCSKKCVREMRRKRQEENEQLCWRCKNACCGCNWSKYFKPVEGWVAEPVIIKDSTGDFWSFKIKKCPEFIKG